MRQGIYNLEFPSWCPSMTIYGYRFVRADDYRDRIMRLQHLVTSYAEFAQPATTGKHARTAYVELPDQEDSAVLEWAISNSTALSDILLLLSIFTGRDVFSSDDNESTSVILADPRRFQWGGTLICSIPYKEHPPLDPTFNFGYDIGLEEGVNQIYELVRSQEWQDRYERGYFLFQAKQAFHRQSLESSFNQCWTIWEHLFAVRNRNWLSAKQIHQLHSSEKIAFILTQYALRSKIDATSRQRINSLAEIRNRLVHFGKFPERGSVHDDAILFIRLTEFVLGKILGLSPSNVFNTMEKLEEFLGSMT